MALGTMSSNSQVFPVSIHGVDGNPIPNFSKVILSGSTDGRPIKVVATATAGTLIHTASASAIDEIWLYAVNTGAASQQLTIEYGGVSDPDDLIEVTITDQVGLVLVVPGLVIQNGLVIRAFAAAANEINISGFVNRIS